MIYFDIWNLRLSRMTRTALFTDSYDVSHEHVNMSALTAFLLSRTRGSTKVPTTCVWHSELLGLLTNSIDKLKLSERSSKLTIYSTTCSPTIRSICKDYESFLATLFTVIGWNYHQSFLQIAALETCHLS